MDLLNDRILTFEDYERIVKDPIVRRAVARDSLRLFFAIYFRHYIEYPIAPFHEEIIKQLEDPATRLLAVMAFRGSAKSTIVSLVYAIWAILGRQGKKHVLILSQTVPQAKRLLAHIREEYESNVLLRDDMGPFIVQEADWNAFSISLPKYGARITVASMEQNVRGLRHGAHRPDVVILDDIESSESIRTQEGRDKAYQWITSDVVPASARGAKIVILGTMTHPDSVLMRLRERIEGGRMDGVFLRTPIVGENGEIMWPGKYRSREEVEEERRRSGSDAAFRREYLLEDIPEGEPVIKREWIQYYDEMPSARSDAVEATLISVDAAISDKSTADYTAIVTGVLFGRNEEQKLYVIPPVINERMGFHDNIERIKRLYRVVDGWNTKILIEDVSFQRGYAETLDRAGYKAVLVPPHGSKRERLTLTTHMLQSGRVFFPRLGADTLIAQLVGFGSEKHDDLADAFSQLVIHCVTKERGRARVAVGRPDAIGGGRYYPPSHR